MRERNEGLEHNGSRGQADSVNGGLNGPVNLPHLQYVILLSEPLPRLNENKVQDQRKECRCRKKRKHLGKRRSERCLQVGTLSTPETTLHFYPHLAQAVRVVSLAHYTRVKAARWHLSTEVKTGLRVIMPGSCYIRQKVGRHSKRSNKWEVKYSSLVCKGLAHGVGDVLGADAEHVKQLLGLSAAGNTGHCQPGHHDARLCTHSRQHSFTETTWKEEIDPSARVTTHQRCHES